MSEVPKRIFVSFPNKLGSIVGNVKEWPIYCEHTPKPHCFISADSLRELVKEISNRRSVPKSDRLCECCNKEKEAAEVRWIMGAMFVVRRLQQLIDGEGDEA